MEPKEKKERKAKLNEYVNLGNGRFKDNEIETLEALVDQRESLDGKTRKHRSSYKIFDSEDTYRVEEQDTYTFRNDDSGIRIDRDFQRDWDDGQHDEEHESFDTARGILNVLSKLFK